MAKKKEQKKENKILSGIVMLILGIGLIAASADYVWVLFGVIELPLWLLGGFAAVAGVVSLVQGVKEKKAAKAASAQEVPSQQNIEQ